MRGALALTYAYLGQRPSALEEARRGVELMASRSARSRWMSRLPAMRAVSWKDLEFCRALFRDGIVDPRTLSERLAGVGDLSQSLRDAVKARIPRRDS